MTKRLSREWHATVTDVTPRYAQINLQGPKSRDLLQQLTSRDMHFDFDFRRAEEIDIGIARALCMRITYVGELGYELFIPAEHATQVYDRILEVGKEFGLKHAGLKALGSLRMVRCLCQFVCFSTEKNCTNTACPVRWPRSISLKWQV